MMMIMTEKSLSKEQGERERDEGTGKLTLVTHCDGKLKTSWASSQKKCLDTQETDAFTVTFGEGSGLAC